MGDILYMVAGAAGNSKNVCVIFRELLILA